MDLLLDPRARVAWRLDAACRGSDPEIFYLSAERDERTGRRRNGGSGTAAKAICATCPVRLRCVVTAVDTMDHDGPGGFGIWGGVGHSRRRGLLRAWKARECDGLIPLTDPEGCGCTWCRTVREHFDSLLATERPDIPYYGPGAECGKASKYARGCRCQPCKVAWAFHETARKAKRPGERREFLGVRLEAGEPPPKPTVDIEALFAAELTRRKRRASQTAPPGPTSVAS